MTDPLVLVIEDNESISRFLSANLERRGYRLQSANNGATGLRMACDLKPDLILLDLKLPEMSGWDVLKALRQQSQACHAPVLVLTADAAEQDEEQARELGATDYLVKPISVSQLLERVRLALHQV